MQKVRDAANFRVTVSWSHLGRAPGAAPTIYESLKAKLGREPTHGELCEDVRRILRRDTVPHTH